VNASKPGPSTIGLKTSAAAVGLVLLPIVVQAQMFSYGGTMRRSVQALSFTTYFINFEYDGRGDPVNRLDFSDRAYGVMYNRPNFAAAIVWGSPDAEFSEGSLNLVDAVVTFWGNIYRTAPAEASQLSIPIVIHSGYRSVDPPFSTSPNDGFNYTSLGIGGGLSLHSEISGHFWIDVRAWPVMSLTFRSFEGFAGSSFLVDTDAQVHVIDVFGSVGISVGYGFRYQDWNNDETGLPGGGLREDQFDYKSSQHMLRAGINF
jgi:hypothetical protein